MGKDFGSHVLGQLLKLRFELVAEFDLPSHEPIMTCNTYEFKIMSDRSDSPFVRETVKSWIEPRFYRITTARPSIDSNTCLFSDYAV